MPVPQRLSLIAPSGSNTRKPESATFARPSPAWEERWWFPLGSITRVGEGAFRWHAVGKMPGDSQTFTYSGRLELYDGVGILHDEDTDEGNLDEDPSESWYENLPPFPYVHLFFDKDMDSASCEWGPWCCMHGIYRFSRAELELACKHHKENSQNTED